MMTKNIYITHAKRSAIGNFNGSLAPLSADQIGSQVIKSTFKSQDIEQADHVIIGQVLTALCGQNPARIAAINAGVSDKTPAYTVNQVCGSGMKAVHLACAEIMIGNANFVIAGGQESMSNAPHAARLRAGVRMSDCTLQDTMINDGLTDAFNHYHMGVTAENIAKKYQITREMQDEYANQSQQRAEAALTAQHFDDEIVDVLVKARKLETVFKHDEFVRKGCTADALSKLKPAFDRKGGTVTAGNASGINDGAAMLGVASAEYLQTHKLQPLARIAGIATSGVAPEIMGLGPVSAVKKALDHAGWVLQDIELAELNEAFAVQSIAVARDLEINPEIVNVSGGAIALGHPIGASGARVLVTLLHNMQRLGKKRGVAALCIGGGMGIATCVELV